jgi:putative Ca2+/H+ antiporter (TMEM165/GDT1 family)
MSFQVRALRDRDLREGPFLIVIAEESLSTAYLAADHSHWLRAVAGMVLGLLLAGLLRLILGDVQSGLLRVRRKSFDVVAYWALATATLVFGLVLHQR